MPLTFADRYQQARLFAAQVRVRKAMGDKYWHAKSQCSPLTEPNSSVIVR